MKLVLVVAMAALIQPPSLLWAQEDEERPERGVARVSLINGDVSVRRGDSGDWTAAALNAPLVVQDSVFTGPASRAEVQFDYANMLRMASNAEVRMAELSYGRYLIQLARGMTTLRVLRDSEAEVEVSTPNVSLRPVKKGIYRIFVRDDGSVELTVRSGEAEIFTPRGAERLRSGRTMMARGTASDPEFQVVNALGEDDWDRWNERRDHDLTRSRSYQYVSRDIYGAEDLDDHGRWVYAPPYGWVWTPHVAAGWAPYRHGRWSWIDWYGWSWVSYDSWGWAPYHYGRWFNHAPYGWCWYPGAVRSRHWWRPGLVAWVGWNSWSGVNVGIGLGFGRVGWIPLAPYERFHPWYGRNYYHGYRNNTYIDNSVRIVNNVNITNVYRNARVGNGISVVDGEDFRHGRGGRMLNVSEAEIRQARVVEGRLPVAPTRESLRLADRPVRAVSASTVPSERFHTSRAVSAPDRVPFDQQRQGMENVARRVFNPEATRAGAGGRAAETRADTGRSAGTVRGADSAGTPRGSSGAPSRVAEPAGRASGRAAEQGSTAEGWRRIGEPVRGSTPNTGSAGRVSSPAAESRAAEGGRVLTTTPSRVEGRGSGSDGWRRFGEPVRGSTADTPATGRGSSSPSTGRATEGGRVQTTTPSRVEGRGSGSDGWRRFGEPVRSGSATQDRSTVNPGGSTGRVAPSPAPSRIESSGPSESSGRSGSSDTWRRFSGTTRGESQGSSPARSAEPRYTTPSAPQSGVRVESPASGRSAPSQRTEPRQYSIPNSGSVASPRSSSSSQERQSRWSDYGSRRSEAPSRSESPRYEQPRSETPVRISPPIIRERGDSGASRSSGRTYGGESSRSAPSMSSPGGSSGRSSGSYGGMSGGSSGRSSSGGGGRVSGGGGGRSSGGGRSR